MGIEASRPVGNSTRLVELIREIYRAAILIPYRVSGQQFWGSYGIIPQANILLAIGAATLLMKIVRICGLLFRY